MKRLCTPVFHLFFSLYSALVPRSSWVPCDPDLFPMTIFPLFLDFWYLLVDFLLAIYCCQPFYYLHFTFWILDFSYHY